ncbi:MAG: response regulator [Anaerolineales bacterium]|nr:response regulator [Anaerolineales bacterium]
MKLTPRLTRIFILYAAGLLSVVGVLAYNSGRNSLRSAVISELSATSIEKQAALNEWVEDKRSNIAALAADPTIIADASDLMTASSTSIDTQAAHDKFVAKIQPRIAIGEFMVVMLIDPLSGEVIAATDPSEEGKFQEDRLFFINGKLAPYVQNVYYSTTLQRPAMTASAPLKGADGQLLGVLAGRIDLAEMNSIINRRSGLRQTDEAFLVNTSNLFITQPYLLTDPAVLQRGVHTEAVNRCLARSSGTLEADDHRGMPAVINYRWIAERELCLIVKIDQAEAFAPARAFGGTLAAISALALGMAALLAVALARSLTQPILALQAGAFRYSRGELDTRLPEASRDELGELAHEFNQMAAALSEKENQLRAYSFELENRVEERTAELQKSEEVLRLENERFLRFIDSNIVGIVIADAGGEIILANDYYLNILGVTRREFLDGKVDWTWFTPPEWLPADQKAIAELLERGICEPYEKEYQRSDGTRVPVYIANAMLPGSGTQIAAFVLDITERKRANEKIIRQNAYLTALHDIDLAIVSAVDMRVSLNSLLSRAVSLLAVDAAAVLLVNPDTNKLKFFAGLGFRTPAIESAEIELGEGHAGRAALEGRLVQIPNLADESEDPLLANSLKEEMFLSYYGLPLSVKGKVIGVLELFHRTIIERDQEWLEFLSTLAGQAAIAIDNAQLFNNLQRSNTELEERVAKRTEELNHTNAELEHANRAKDEFLANMSHELRTPLNSILGLSESLLEQRRGLLNENQQNSLQIIQSSGHHLLELINDILDLSKIEAGNFDYYPQSVDVNALCKASLFFVKSQAAKKSININYNNQSPGSTISADPRRLKQILVNLLANAVKFTPNNGHVTLQVSTDRDKELIQFSVIDTGVGIAAEDLKRLFTPFVQVDSSLNRQFEGTGLGLALVQKLTDLHGGSVQVESEVGKGSRFTINLHHIEKPVEQVDESQTVNPYLSDKQTNEVDFQFEGKSPAPRRKILIAEDNETNVITIGENLESHGYEIQVAHDGLEAIAKAQETSPDIILMDIQMPLMNGLEAMRRLRAEPRFASTPIIAITALAMVGDRERCLEAGATEYLSKPVSLKALRQMIETLLADIK